VAIRSVWSWVQDLKTELENLSVEALAGEIEGGEDLLLVDLREIQERVDRGAIPGSKHVPRGMLEFWADPQSEYYRDYFEEGKRTVVYCAAGGRSALAAKVLLDMGFRDVAHLEDGFAGWEAAGQTVEETASKSRWVRR